MKTIGAVLIIVSCGLLGVNFYKKCISKLKFTQCLIDGLEYIKNEISFTQPLLFQTFIDAAVFSGSAGNFFKELGELISVDGITLEEAFVKSKFPLKASSNNQVYSVIHDIVLQLGMGDTENQINLLNSAINKLRTNYNNQKAFCEKEGAMCKKIGFVMGVAVSIILL